MPDVWDKTIGAMQRQIDDIESRIPTAVPEIRPALEAQLRDGRKSLESVKKRAKLYRTAQEEE